MKILKTVFWLSLLVLVDQLIKGWVRSGPSFVINRQYLVGQYIFDPVVVACIILLFVLLLVWLDRKDLDKNRLSLILIISGTTSNLVDRLYWGGIIDFMAFQIANFKLFFNIADVFIILGIILYVTKAQKNFN